MYHITEFVADLRDEPVPTTSPTYASACPFSLSSAICCFALWMPSLSFLSIALACSGMSGRLHASGAGERSSVFVSPVTLNTVTVIFSATFGFAWNHSASAQDSMIAFANSFPFFAFSSTSWNASKTRSVCVSAFCEIGARSGSSSASIKHCTLKPPSMVPKYSVASCFEITEQLAVPFATWSRKNAFSFAASSTPAGTRSVSRYFSHAASSPSFSASNWQTFFVWAAVRGVGGMPSASRSATCCSYSFRNVAIRRA
mmetsp:Transcript_22464/g.56773  ORF Transcript_22464/g.56773 Transcript_22464/m.56773 type:complete len:257 (+) Transcript_22464:3319-4089(+)